MGTTKLDTSLTQGPMAWISEYNANLDILSSLLSPFGFGTTTNIGELPVGTPAFSANIGNPVLGSNLPITKFPIIVHIQAASSNAFLGLGVDLAGKQTSPGSKMEDILARDRFQMFGYMHLRHTEKPGTPLYAKKSGIPGLTTSSTDSVRVGIYLSNNQILIWPSEL